MLGSLLAMYLFMLILLVNATLNQHHLDVTTSHVVSRSMGHPGMLGYFSTVCVSARSCDDRHSLVL